MEKLSEQNGDEADIRSPSPLRVCTEADNVSHTKRWFMHGPCPLGLVGPWDLLNIHYTFTACCVSCMLSSPACSATWFQWTLQRRYGISRVLKPRPVLYYNMHARANDDLQNYVRFRTYT